MRNCRLILVFAAAILFPLGLACAAPGGTISGPQLHLGAATFDFGQVTEGAVLAHTFVLLNRGDQPLLIENVSPS